MLTIDKVQLEMIINNDPARKAIRETEDQIKQLRKEMKKIPEGTDEWNKKFNELKSAETKLEKLRHEIGLTGMTVKELANRERELNLLMKNLDPRLPMWKEYKAELDAVKQRKLELVKGSQATHLSITRLADGFNRYFGIITAGLATMTGLIFSFRKVIDSFNEFEKKLDRLSALTGLMGAEMDYLSEEAKKMSTDVVEGGVRITQSADMIVDAFTKVGSARPELLKDKEALKDVTQEAIILSEAAGSELQPAVEALAMVMNQFNAQASEARRIINTLAAGSKEGAGEIPYLTTAFEKAGTVASDAGISIEELVGIIETLAPRISQPEIAGRSLKGVILDLQKTSDDTNPAIVGFAQAIENLGKKNLSTTELTKMFGDENITVAKILLNNTEEMNKYTEAVTGTNVAIEQATINTDNNSARLEQARNKIKLLSIELGERLAPALQFSTSGFSYLLKATIAIIKFFDEYGAAVVSATAGIVAYTVAVNASAIGTKIYTAYTVVAEKVTKLFNSTLKANPLGLIIGLLTTAATALLLYTRQLSAAEKAQRMLNDINSSALKNITDEKVELELLLKIAKDYTKSKEERLSAVKKLNELSPDYLGNLTLETIHTKEATEATEKYIESLLQKAKLEAVKEKLIEVEKELIDVQQSGSAANIKWYQAAWNTATSLGGIAEVTAKNVQSSVNNTNRAIDELIAKRNLLTNILTTGSGSLPSSSSQINDEDSSGGAPMTDNKTNISGETFDQWKEQQDRIFIEKNKYIASKIEEQSIILGEAHQASLEEFGDPLGLPNAEEEDQNMIYILEKYQETVDGRLAINQAFFDADIIGETEYNDRKKALMEEDAANHKAIQDKKLQQAQVYFQGAQSLMDSIMKFNIASMNKELKAAGDNEKKKEEIQRKYAQQQKSIAIIQAIINTALGVTSALTMMPPASYIFAALTAIAGAAEIAVISSQQFAEGNFMDVIGKQTGKTYRARVTGSDHPSGLFSEPTYVPGFGLFGETKRPELVFNPADSDKIINSQGAINAINMALGKQPQYAQGNTREIIKETRSETFTDPVMLSAINRLNENIERGINAKVVTTEDNLETWNRAQTDLSSFKSKVNAG